MKKFNFIYFFVFFVVMAVFLSFSEAFAQGEYTVQINPEDFTTVIDNPYFTLKPGTVFNYENVEDDEVVQIKTIVTDETKMIMGVETVVVWDREFEDGELIEDTYDWFAQDKEGNVWYFGEITWEYEDGEPATSKGSWEAGVDGALPGIIMKAEPRVGDSYFMEYYPGEALDTLDVLAVNQSITTPAGTFTGCVKVKEGSALAMDLLDHKYYCPEIGAVAYIIDVKTGEEEYLLSVDFGDGREAVGGNGGSTLGGFLKMDSYLFYGVVVFVLVIVLVLIRRPRKKSSFY